ncbi:hypothetical protein GCM10027258_69430 [Amycolatopsis stemonae]
MEIDCLKAVLQRIRTSGRERYTDGFVQASIDSKSQGATVFWHGETPQEIRQIAKTSTLADRISFVAVPYSLEQLRIEAKRISSAYPYVIFAGPSADYKSINVRVDKSSTASEKVDIISTIPLNIEGESGGFSPSIPNS